MMQDFAPFRQNPLRDSATQGTEKGNKRGAENGTYGQ
jgi:hypothetical protein